jgi:D-serine deaminase-like pyridoxal phosphate-dependent protein
VNLTYGDFCGILQNERLPAAIVDLDAFDANLDRMRNAVREHALTLRLATKSVRVPALIQRALDHGGGVVKGLMCFSAEEAALLAEQDFDDLLVAYPTLQRGALDRLAALANRGVKVSLAVDSEDAVDALELAAATAGAKLDAVVCVDMSLEMFGGFVHAGVRRSPLHRPEDVVRMATYVQNAPNLRFHGILAYEAQVAGVGDESPVMRTMRKVSMREITRRRPEIVRQLKDANLAPTLVNGGGTGSIDETTAETGVTEIAAGSGLFKPHLFDHYSSPSVSGLRPALFFALATVRRPSPIHITCGGGGYVASGSVGADKHPLPWLPEGLRLLSMEMAGEVQTPLEGDAAKNVKLGEPIVFRPAKAGEPLERFSEVLLVSGNRIVDRVPTYRGLGWTFM